MKLYDMEPIFVAGAVALKKCLEAFVAVPIIGAAIGVGQITTELGTAGVAVVASLVGALCRWYYFGLDRSDGIKGVVISPVIAVVLSDSKIPFFSFFLGDISPESLPIINGFFVGMFGLLLVGFFVDFAKAYANRKGKG